MVIFRSFLSSGVLSGVYNYVLYSERIKHLNYLASFADATEILAKPGNESANFYRNIQAQATLTASKEISGNIILFGIFLVAMLVVVHIYNRFKHGNNYRRRIKS